MERARWVDRKFSFDCPVGWLPNVIERLLGTSVRMHALTAELNEDLATRASNGGWSIKEHIGHLTDLEELHMGRLQDFRERKPTLRAADMSNQKTVQAQHNQRSLQRLINDFRKERRLFVEQLNQLDADLHDFTSLHPRLQKPMRPIDVAYFTAEHDDHHLASIRYLIKVLKK